MILIASSISLSKIKVLGHHGDDQVETMLMKMAKGTVGIGLAGIQPKRRFDSGWLLRPFLRLSKDDLLAYCKEKNVKIYYEEMPGGHEWKVWDTMIVKYLDWIQTL